MKKFSHLDEKGRAKMVDVGHKPAQQRIAVAEGFVRCQPKTIAAIFATVNTSPFGNFFAEIIIAHARSTGHQ